MGWPWLTLLPWIRWFDLDWPCYLGEVSLTLTLKPGIGWFYLECHWYLGKDGLTLTHLDTMDRIIDGPWLTFIAWNSDGSTFVDLYYTLDRMIWPSLTLIIPGQYGLTFIDLDFTLDRIVWPSLTLIPRNRMVWPSLTFIIPWTGWPSLTFIIPWTGWFDLHWPWFYLGQDGLTFIDLYFTLDRIVWPSLTLIPWNRMVWPSLTLILPWIGWFDRRSTVWIKPPVLRSLENIKN